ncbi:hypothetical protein [Lentzea sp.]|uniref:hypothetical protein n=1 Tax=Lentzea sp. TaxID=56099 RepID=UPI002C52E00F|nr:hypothetical protein [Lentzea sp.]HUQ57286.1 hypothetical protein [Lentzea sp.]
MVLRRQADGPTASGASDWTCGRPVVDPGQPGSPPRANAAQRSIIHSDSRRWAGLNFGALPPRS